MVQQVHNVIKGLLPTIDRRKVPEPFVLDGKNFLVDADGPYSAFGYEFISADPITDPEQAQTFRVGSEIFLFVKNAVLQFDITSESFIPVMLFTENTNVFPWSSAIVGGLFYFCKIGSGVIQYNATTGVWLQVDVSVVTGTPYAITQSNARLIIQTDLSIHYSEIDSGTALTPSTTTGAGAQLTSIIGNGTPLGVFEIEEGFLTYTTTGILKSRKIDSINPFHHTPLTRKFIPINPYCIIETDDFQHVMLTKRGLFSTGGKKPVPFQPLMGEYFHRTILPLFDLSKQAIVRLHFADDKQWFTISVAENQQQFVYSRAYVLYLPTEEWGSFDRPHVAIGDFNLSAGAFSGFNLGFINIAGQILRFNDNPKVEIEPTAGSGENNLWRYRYNSPVQYPARAQPSIGGVYAMPSVIRMRVQSEDAFPVTGFYDQLNIDERALEPVVNTSFGINSSYSPVADLYSMREHGQGSTALVIFNVILLPITFGSVDSFIDVGLFRLLDELDNDRMSYIVNESLGMLESPVIADEEDWLDPVDEIEFDWLTDTSGDEDWGAGLDSATDYILTVVGTKDGTLSFETTTPVIQLDEGKTRFYTDYNNGLYHYLHIDATADEFKSFHLKTLELDINLGGRL